MCSLSPSQGYQTLADLHRGQRILVLGGSGGVGTVGVQIARHIGAHVIATCSGRNVALVRSLGADEVIDYTAVDLATLAIEPVDVGRWLRPLQRHVAAAEARWGVPDHRW